MTDLFKANEDTTRPEDIPNPFEHLVGEGKKYKDTNSLAFAALKKDEHISTIERENAEARAELERLRTELATRGTVEDALKRLQAPSANVESNPDHGHTQVDKSSPEDIQKTVKSILEHEREVEKRRRNVAEVTQTLEQTLGRDYGKRMLEVAEELGSKELLMELAETNPKALLRLVGAQQAPVQKTLFETPPSTRINSLSNTSPSIKGHKYYQELRRKDPKGWQRNAAKLEEEMQQAVAKYGQAYFEN